jgi:hypothetical protein
MAGNGKHTTYKNGDDWGHGKHDMVLTTEVLSDRPRSSRSSSPVWSKTQLPTPPAARNTYRTYRVK